MKSRSPLRQLFFAPILAIAMISGALTPLATAQAEPVDPDNDAVVEVTPSPSIDGELLQDEELTDEPPETEAIAEASPDAAVSDETAPEESLDKAVAEDEVAAAGVAEDATSEVQASKDVIADAVMADQTEAEVIEALERDYDVSTRSSTSAAVPLTVEAAAVVEARGMSKMRLRKSNGAWVTITPKMQANALVVINTIKSAKWRGVSNKEKDRLTVIALMVMAQESTFYTHPYAHVPDRNQDVGPFQQRSKVGWYADGRTQAENIRILNNIPYATKTFIQGHRVPRAVRGGAGPRGYVIPGVFQTKNWRNDAMWEVAANVQRPARQYRYNYEYWRPVVQSMIKALRGSSAKASSPADVYTQAGDHKVNGRSWRTTCEKYSKTIKRCTARIWATQVTRQGSRYVSRNGWYFNNLTYLPAKRSEWKKNPLGYQGKFTSAARQWKTDCDRGWTGPPSCRSYVRSSVIESYFDSRGNRQFRSVKKWVFNNIVQFR